MFYALGGFRAVYRSSFLGVQMRRNYKCLVFIVSNLLLAVYFGFQINPGFSAFHRNVTST